MLGQKWLFLLVLFTLPLSANENTNEKLKEAYHYYEEGVTAETIAKKETFFNRSLEIYSALEDQYKSRYDLSPLYFNIGNTYTQLNSFPWAILYYYKALQTDPRNQVIIDNLRYASSKLGVTPSYQPPLVAYSEILALISCLVILTLFFFSLKLWSGRPLWVKCGFGAGFISVGLFAFVLFSAMNIPFEGVIISPTLLHRSPDSTSPYVAENPFPSGLKVKVIGSKFDGNWLKIQSEDNAIGYIYYKNVRII